LENQLLNGLPAQDARFFQPLLERVKLESGTVICGLNHACLHAYFPTSGVISLVGMSREGLGVEIGMVGREGFLGLNILLGKPTLLYQAIVQHPGEALRVQAEAFIKIADQHPLLRAYFLAYCRVRLAQVAQAAICNRFHPLEQRLCRWLLSAQDRVQSARLPLTQELLSDLLGGRRPTVGTATNHLEKTGLIECQRGQIIILDRPAMERAACECYEVVKKELEDFVRSAPGRRG
jgi:CRP-like cAMP-binding protein